ncbi:RidA family protein [Sphingobium sp.]|uniref:RidA family protein n=1 Tax=Sphingobium sp. TaxID=1912891 RepID=UPI003B3A8236
MSSSPQPVAPEGREPPKGHYSPGMTAAPFLFISGHLPSIAPGSADLDAEAESAIRAMLEVLEAAGGTTRNLARVTVYLAGVEHWPAFNDVYARIMGDARPARTVVPVPALHHGYLVEIDAIAMI